MHQSVEVVRGEDEAVACGVVAPAAEQQVSTQAVLQRARQVLVEDRVQIVVIGTFKKKGKDNHHSNRAKINMSQMEIIRW